MVYGELAAVSTSGSVLSYVSAKSKDATSIFSEIIISKENISKDNSSVKTSVKYAVAYDSNKYFFTKYDTSCSFPVKDKPRSCIQLIEHSKGEKLDGFKFISPFEIMNPVGKVLSDSVYEISFQTNALEGEFNISFGKYVLDPEISACGSLPLDEFTTYELTQNITYNGSDTCITFGANYQTLDCKGFSVIGTEVSTDVGVYVPDSNQFSIVKNCNILGFDMGLKIRGSNGVFSNNYISNAQGTGSFLIYIGVGTNNNLINITSYTNRSVSYGLPIFLTGTTGNNISNSSFIKNSSDGFAGSAWFEGAVSGNFFYNNSFWSVNDALHFASDSPSNLFLNNTIQAATQWVHDESAGNIYNDSFTGNKYVFDNGTGSWMVCNITDTNSNGYADIGSDLPFNDANTCMGSYWIGGGEDYHPWSGLITMPIQVAQLATRVSNRFNVTISSSMPLLVANYTYILPTQSVSFLFGSFYAAKIGGGNSNLHVQIVSNGVTIYNKSVVSFLSNGMYRTQNFPKSPVNSSSAASNNLEIYMWSSAGSPIGVYDVGLGFTFDKVSDNVTNITWNYVPIITSWSGVSNTNLSSLSVNNSINSDVYASFWGVINASDSTTVSMYLKDNVSGATSPSWKRALTTSSDSGVIGGSWIFRNVSSTQIILIVNSSENRVVSFNGNKFNKNYNNSYTNIHNANYSVTSPVSIGAAYTIFLNKTLMVEAPATTGIFVESFNSFQRLTSNPVVDVKCEVYNNSVLFDTKFSMRSMSSTNTFCEPKLVFFARYPSEATLYPNNISVVCSARNTGTGTVNLVGSSLVMHELLEINATYIPRPPIVSITAPDNGSSQLGNYSINWSISSLYPITTNLTLTNTTGYSVNITGMNESKTTYIIDTTGYNTGLWTINVSSNNAYGTGSDQVIVNYVAATTTTTTIPTTTIPSTTTTTIPPGAVPANSTLYIFSILAPILAVIFTLAAIFGGSKAGILPSVFASTLWYASSMFSTRIRFIGDFTVSMTEHYVDAGNWEVGTLFLTFAAIMALYTVVLVLDFVYSGNKQNG